MLKLNNVVLAVLVFSMLALMGCEKKQENYLVDVDGQKLTSEVFNKRFKTSQEFRKGKEVTSEQVKNFIDKYLIENLLFQAEGYSNGIDKDEKVVDFLEKKKISLLTDSRSKLLKKVQDENVNITEKDVENFYKSLTHEVKVAHIMTRSKSLADSLYTELQKDKTKYHDFAQQHSLDMRSGAGGGVLGRYFTKGTFPSTFEDGAFALEKNEISKPVKTRFGYHLIKLMDKRLFENQPFEKVENGLKKKLESIEKKKSFDKFFNDLFKENALSINENLLKFVTKNMETKNRMLLINKDNIPESELKKTVLDYKGGKWILETVIDKYNSSHSRGKMPLGSKDLARDFIYKTVTPDLIYNKAVAEGYDKDEEYLKKITYFEEQQVKRICQQKLIQKNVDATEEEMKNYYDGNIEKYKNKEYDKVKRSIKNRLNKEKREQQKTEVINMLKAKYSINYNENAISIVVKELNEQRIINKEKAESKKKVRKQDPADSKKAKKDVRKKSK